MAMFLLNGCNASIEGFLSTPYFEVIEGAEGDSFSAIGHTGADRRVILGMMSKDKVLQFCAESLPDVGYRNSEALKALYKSLEISATATRAPVRLFNRTAVIELTRNNLFGLCQIAINENLTGEQVEKLLKTIIESSFKALLHDQAKSTPK